MLIQQGIQQRSAGSKKPTTKTGFEFIAFKFMFPNDHDCAFLRSRIFHINPFFGKENPFRSGAVLDIDRVGSLGRMAPAVGTSEMDFLTAFT
jgi:hypothetical protein